jgi:hypothetical protein
MTTQSVINYLRTVQPCDLENYIIMIDETHHPTPENRKLLGIANYMIVQQFSPTFVLASATPPDYKLFTNLVTDHVFKLDETQFPVKWNWLESDENGIDLDDVANISKNEINSWIKDVFSDASNSSSGNILIFVSTIADVKSLFKHFTEEDECDEYDVYELHSELSTSQMEKCNIEGKKRKIIVSTNIAENGVTIPDVSIVIDSMLACDVLEQVDSTIVETIIVSKSSAKQRAGRAGRTQSGHYFPFCSENNFKKFDEHTPNSFDKNIKYPHVLEQIRLGYPKEILCISDDEYHQEIDFLKTHNFLTHFLKISFRGQLFEKLLRHVSFKTAILIVNFHEKTKDCENFNHYGITSIVVCSLFNTNKQCDLPDLLFDSDIDAIMHLYDHHVKGILIDDKKVPGMSKIEFVLKNVFKTINCAKYSNKQIEHFCKNDFCDWLRQYSFTVEYENYSYYWIKELNPTDGKTSMNKNVSFSNKAFETEIDIVVDNKCFHALFMTIFKGFSKESTVFSIAF